MANVNVSELINFHKAHGKQATVTAVSPPGRFGQLQLDGDRVTDFLEKPAGGGGLINGGFFVLSPRVGALIESDATIWEQKPLMTLAKTGELEAYHHTGFWQPMDTLRDANYLNALWNDNTAPWKLWT